MTTAATIDLAFLARELGLPVEQAQRTLQLLDDGNTIPFITRYRKEVTGGLNEEQILRIQQEAEKLRLLSERKQSILRSIEGQGILTPELAAKISSARTLKWLEDVYLPYKPKKRTLATIARQRGLEPLAREVLDANPAADDLRGRAEACVSAEGELRSVDEVLQGVGHILAEVFSERVDVRGRLRKALRRDGVMICSRIDPAESTASSETPASEPQSANPSTAEKSVAPLEPIAGGTGLVAAAESNELSPPDGDGAAGGNVGNLAGESALLAPSSGVSPDGSAVAGTPAAATIATCMPPGPLAAQLSAKRNRARKQLARERKKRMLEHAFKDYYNFREPISRLPPHRVLAINRGERAKILRVRVDYQAEALIKEALHMLVPENHPHATYLREWARDAVQRLILPSLERELRRELLEEAEEHAVQVFVRNLRKLLLQPPVRGKRVLAVDPGFRSGCKLAAVDPFGNLLEHGVIHLVGSDEQRTQARATLSALIHRHQLEIVAIGNGAGCRAAEQIVSDVIAEELKGSPIAYVIVNEAGASFYSTSQVGRDELPHCDPMMRSAVSIGRRLQDPMSELVKINPANIGVGMYQHDMKLKNLRDSLDAVVNLCVNYVGVDLNTASPSLLRYVSGLNQLTARRLYEYRQQHGPFRNRQQLLDVPGIGDASFVQAAGFLRILDGDNPLDATWIHPESYESARRVLEKLAIPLSALITRKPPESCQTAAVGSESPSPTVAGPGERPASAGCFGPVDTAGSPTALQALDAVASADPANPPAADDPIGDSIPTASAPDVSHLNANGPSLTERLAAVAVNQMAPELEISELLLRDILAALAKPGRDPRDDFSPPPFRTGIMKLEDLKSGMELQATVLNVVDFGAFVDIGISDSALIHISKLADQFIRDPQEVVSVGDILKVWVIEVDKERRRVSLTAIDPHAARKPRERREGRPRRSKPPRATTAPPAAAGAIARTPEQPGRQPRPARRPQRQQGKKPAPSGNRTAASAPPPPKPVRPITPGMLSGKQPMRSFSDLMQFYNKKQQGPTEKQ